MPNSYKGQQPLHKHWRQHHSRHQWASRCLLNCSSATSYSLDAMKGHLKNSHNIPSELVAVIIRNNWHTWQCTVVKHITDPGDVVFLEDLQTWNPDVHFFEVLTCGMERYAAIRWLNQHTLENLFEGDDPQVPHPKDHHIYGNPEDPEEKARFNTVFHLDEPEEQEVEATEEESMDVDVEDGDEAVATPAKCPRVHSPPRGTEKEDWSKTKEPSFVLGKDKKAISTSSKPVSYTHLTLPTICSV